MGQTIKAWFEGSDNRAGADGRPAPQTTRSTALTVRRSADNAIARGSRAAENEPTPADDGATVETATAKKKAGGSGQGDDTTATGEGPGENPADKSGPTGDSARLSDDGTTSTNNDSSAQPDNAASVGREMGPEEPGPGQSGEMGEGDPTNSGKGEGESNDKFGEGEGDGKGNGDGEGGEPPIEQEVKRFIERHGAEIEEARKALDRKQGATSNAQSSSPPRERETSNESTEGAPPADVPPPASAPQENEQPDKTNSNPTSEPPSKAPAGQGDPRNQPERQREPTAASNEKDTGDGKPSEKRSNEQPRSSGDADNSGDSKDDSKSDSKSTGDMESSGGQAPSKEQQAPRPQPDAPADGKNSPNTPDPESGASDDPASNPGTAPKGENAGGPAPGDLADSATDGKRASSGAVSVPGQKTQSEPVEAPSSPGAETGPISREPGDSKTDRTHGDVQNVLELLERAEAIGPETFDELPWPADKKAAFLRDLKRLDSLSKRSANFATIQRWREGGQFGDSQIQVGRGGADASLHVGDEAMQADALDKLAAPPDQNIPPHLRAVLDAYYRSLAAKRQADSPR